MEFVLVGREAEVTAELGRMSVQVGDPGIRLVIAEEVVAMDESPSHALRSKRSSSLHRAVELVAERQADGVVSAGNTGAAVAVMLFVGCDLLLVGFFFLAVWPFDPLNLRRRPHAETY